MVTYRSIMSRIALPKELLPFSEAAEEYILNQLLQEAVIGIKPDELSSEIARLQAFYNHNLQFELLEKGDYSVFLPENREKQQRKIRQEAERALKTERLLYYIAEHEHIVVTEEEREMEAKRIAAENKISLENVHEFMGASYELLQEDLVLRKTIRWLCDYVQANTN